MKNCPKCSVEHNKRGPFCSHKCANGRQHSNETRAKIALACMGNRSRITVESIEKARITRQKSQKIKYQNRLLFADFDTLSLALKKLRILNEQNHKCLLCGIDESWNFKPLKFDLDHVDGDRNNNKRENLRCLCPNCHSQTDTYKSGNNKFLGQIKVTDEEIIKALKNNESAYQTLLFLKLNTHGGNYKRLRRIVKKYGLQLNYLV